MRPYLWCPCPSLWWTSHATFFIEISPFHNFSFQRPSVLRIIATSAYRSVTLWTFIKTTIGSWKWQLCTYVSTDIGVADNIHQHRTCELGMSNLGCGRVVAFDVPFAGKQCHSGFPTSCWKWLCDCFRKVMWCPKYQQIKRSYS